MSNSTAPEAADIECTIRGGPNVQYSACPDGCITIQTETELVTILLQQIIDKKKTPVKCVDRKLDRETSPSGSCIAQAKFWFARDSDLEDTRQSNDGRSENLSNDGRSENLSKDGRSENLSNDNRIATIIASDVASTIGNRAKNQFVEGDHGCVHGEGEGDDRSGIDENDREEFHDSVDEEDRVDAINSNGFTNTKVVQKKPKTQLSDKELLEKCQELALKISKKWKSQAKKAEESLKALLLDYSNFFGEEKYTTLHQWSYKVLDNQEKFGELQGPFHKFALASWWNRFLKDRTSKKISPHLRSQTLTVLEPDFPELGRKAKHAKRMQIDRYIRQGEVISLILDKAPGLVVMVYNLLTTSEYDLLWRYRHQDRVSGLDWISVEMIEDSALYSGSVKGIFNLMPQYFVSIHQQTSYQGSIHTLSNPPMGSEIRTNIALPCQQGAPTSQDLIPSCQISPSSLQTRKKTTKARANTAKRRRLSKDQCIQIPAVRQTTTQGHDKRATQPESEHPLTEILSHSVQQSSSLHSEEGGSIDRGRMSPASDVETYGDLAPILGETEEMQDRSVTSFGLQRTEATLGQRLSAHPPDPRRSTLDNASVQQSSLADDMPSPNPNIDPNFKSYATEIVEMLDDDARKLFGLGDDFR